MIMHLLDVKIGMTFSGGLIDFLLFGVMPGRTEWFWVIVVGLFFAVIYYFGFRFAITKFNLMTPGREDEETIISGSLAAANGGFTGIACMPNTEPAIDTQEVVNYIKEQANSLLVDVHPIAAVTKARAGQELAPSAELVEAGAAHQFELNVLDCGVGQSEM